LAPVLFVHASLTEPLVRLATHLIADLGLAGVALLTLTSGVIGAPGTEPTMLFAGFDVFQGNLTLPGIIAAGVVGDIAGASIAYSIGYFGSQELLEHQGSKLHIRPGSIERAHRWFDRYGTPVMFITRLLPFVRAAFPYAAGVARMSYWRCIAAATLGSIVWIGGLGLLGREVGSQWQTWRHHLEYVDYVGVVVVVAAIIYLIVRRVRDQPSEPGAGGTSPEVGGTSSGVGGAGTAVDALRD
jgi:membrane protein DedA with SNARE-associated domain